MGWLLRALVLLLVLRLVLRAAARAQRRPRAPEALVRDPVCGTHLPASRAVGGRFCSEACARAA